MTTLLDDELAFDSGCRYIKERGLNPSVYPECVDMLNTLSDAQLLHPDLQQLLRDTLRRATRP